MKKSILLCLLSYFLLIPQAYATERFITISTTTSIENSGLLSHILPLFTKETGITVHVTAKGTGGAIKDGVDGNVDAIFVHDPIREAQFVKNGYGTKRNYIMYNDFILVGPSSDPAKLSKKPTVEAFNSIATNKILFISRGDDSGTHTKEALIWEKSGVKLDKKYPTDTTWYASIGQGMGKTLLMANERQAYTLTDRGTFESMKQSAKPALDLVIISEGESYLHNPYGYIPVNKNRHPHAKQEDATSLANWLMSPIGKKAIRDFGVSANGKPLFTPTPLEK